MFARQSFAIATKLFIGLSLSTSAQAGLMASLELQTAGFDDGVAPVVDLYSLNIDNTYELGVTAMTLDLGAAELGISSFVVNPYGRGFHQPSELTSGKGWLPSYYDTPVVDSFVLTPEGGQVLQVQSIFEPSRITAHYTIAGGTPLVNAGETTAVALLSVPAGEVPKLPAEGDFFDVVYQGSTRDPLPAAEPPVVVDPVVPLQPEPAAIEPPATPIAEVEPVIETPKTELPVERTAVPEPPAEATPVETLAEPAAAETTELPHATLQEVLQELNEETSSVRAAEVIGERAQPINWVHDAVIYLSLGSYLENPEAGLQIDYNFAIADPEPILYATDLNKYLNPNDLLVSAQPFALDFDALEPTVAPLPEPMSGLLALLAAGAIAGRAQRERRSSR